jgi:hypothetical protein
VYFLLKYYTIKRNENVPAIAQDYVIFVFGMYFYGYAVSLRIDRLFAFGSQRKDAVGISVEFCGDCFKRGSLPPFFTVAKNYKQ